ncbi:ferrochelatase [Actinotalea sp.]|uniref:ferrochelatase n=1 Tax=Actinotalea sp. TaxID=1872145 RepID=UPI0035618BE3
MSAALPPRDPSTPVTYDAVLLTSFGGPEGQDDVLPFLRNVTRGRGIPDERLEEVAHHYRAFGGISPINAQNRELRSALQAEIDSRGLDLPVLWGNRNWDPYLADTLREASAAGHRHLLAVVTSAYSSYSGCRQYREDLATALEETGLAGELSIDKVRQYFDHPGFVTPFVDGVGAGLAALAAGLGHDGDLARDAHVVFVTHSIPTAAAEASGPPGAGLGQEGAYGAQHRAVAELVMASLAAPADGEAGVGLGAGVAWSLAFQSRSGSPSTPWLEPDVNDHLAVLAEQGTKAVVIAPIGFVSDHMEVLWDLDEEASATARELGLLVERAPTPGVHPAFVSGLVDLIQERHRAAGAPAATAERPALSPLGPWYDVCRPGCCAPTRGQARPAVAGLG